MLTVALTVAPCARSAFVWLLSILVVSIAGSIRPLREFLPAMLPLGVLVQELFRWLYFAGFAGLCRRLKAGTPSIEFSVQEQLGIAVGASCLPPERLGPSRRSDRARARARRSERPRRGHLPLADVLRHAAGGGRWPGHLLHAGVPPVPPRAGVPGLRCALRPPRGSASLAARRV